MRFFTLIIVLAASVFISCNKQQKIDIMIIPQPQQITIGDDTFSVNEGTKIIDNSNLNIQSQYLNEIFKKTLGFSLKEGSPEDADEGNCIILKIDQDLQSVNDEGYVLSITKKGIVISANSEKGVFYGIQSLFQIILSADIYSDNNNNKLSLPTLSITDEPLFEYRGMHLDVCRHIFPVDFIYKYIDLLAYYKFNTFHWHLTEDQGWRIEIKKYPKLTEVGSFRDETLIGHYGDKPVKYDGKRYGGYYTQDEIRKIVSYAAKKQITIIPEIEMPGHSLAALASYPELGCTGGPYKTATTWGVFEDIYCTKEETFDFLQNVLLEVMELFPSKYIHIGGDEAPKKKWKDCSVCQSTIKREGLKDEHELQSYFIQRIEKFLNTHGRNIIGWDEILEGGLAPNATVMSWRGIDGGIAAANMGHDAIMTPGSHCYFDHYQANPENEPIAIGGYTTLEKVYFYNPVPEDVSVSNAKHILGAQGNVWTEYMETPEHVEYMILPRMAALSEVVWTGDKNWEDFKIRINHHFTHYDKLGYNYCDHPYQTK